MNVVNGAGTLGGRFVFDDQSTTTHATSDSNRFLLSDHRDGYSTAVRVHHELGSLRLDQHLANGTNGSWTVSLREGSFRTVLCTWGNGGDRARGETYLDNQ